jgi:hypothetical protein
MDDVQAKRIAVADRLWMCMDMLPGDEQVVHGLTADDLRDLAGAYLGTTGRMAPPGYRSMRGLNEPAPCQGSTQTADGCK